MTGYDILFFQETWEIDQINIHGYWSFQTLALGSRAGRSRGGIITLVANTLRLKVKKKFKHHTLLPNFMLEAHKARNWILINFYNNNFEGNQESVLDTLEADIADILETSHKVCNIFWMGDLNAHTCKRGDSIA